MQAVSQKDVLRIASAVGIDDGAFVVGGQALNIWAEYYASRTNELAEFAPYTSKDIDYFGHQEAAKKMATTLGGKVALRWSPATGQFAKLGSPIQKDEPDGGTTEAVFSGF